ncbi:alpha/beta hydrolase [Mammaliicoccus vitulinus]|uniref:alpha/beta hydrolase n=1 Tax=Mammaliicoccus vitulinus TaxID=71237 RepID=UPI0003090D06|nr:alpha/beta hydrolase [Mammaliicoccus vitulinus]
MKLQKYIDILILILTFSLFMLFSRAYLVVPIILIAMLIRLIMSFKIDRRNSQILLTLLTIVFMLLTLIFDMYPLTMFTTIFTGIIFIILLLHDIKKDNKRKTKLHKLISVIGFVGLGILIMGYIAFSYNSIFPDTLTRSTQDIFPSKVVAHKSVDKNKDGTIYYKNLTYPSNYKNNKLDIYRAKNPKGTIFYIHGGGFAFDDKSEREDFLYRYVKEGYNVVNVNYQLSPDIRYPETLKQVNQALTFVNKHSKEYNIDTHKMVFSGDSAGGQLSGQLINVLNDKNYADEVGINVSSNARMKPKGYIAIGALTNSQNIAHTQFFLTDWFFDTLGRSYFETTDVQHNSKAEQAGVINHVKKDFPPTFISDGNFGTFTKDSKKFEQRLKELKIPVTSQFYNQSHGKLFHVYEIDVNHEYARKIHKKHITFLNELFDE